MPQPGSLGSIVPQDDAGALTRRVAELERLVQQMSTARTLEAATIGRGGITIDKGGAITVTDTDGHTVAIIGALPPEFNRTDGSRQPGFIIYREDGTAAATLSDANPTTPPYKQAWQIMDRAGHIIMADDTNGGTGIALPYLNGGAVFADTNVVRWPQTTNGAFTTVADCYYTPLNPRIQWDIEFVADAATAGEVRLLVNGTQVDTTQTVGTSFGAWTRYGVSIPGAWTYYNSIYVALQARRTSGTGGVYATVQRFLGDQSP